MKVKGFLFFSDDFFLPYARLDAMEFDLVRTFRRPSFEDAEANRSERANGSGFFCVVEDLTAGVVFLLHVYTLPQNPEKARDFFAIL